MKNVFVRFLSQQTHPACLVYLYRTGLPQTPPVSDPCRCRRLLRCFHHTPPPLLHSTITLNHNHHCTVIRVPIIKALPLLPLMTNYRTWRLQLPMLRNTHHLISLICHALFLLHLHNNNNNKSCMTRLPLELITIKTITNNNMSFLLLMRFSLVCLALIVLLHLVLLIAILLLLLTVTITLLLIACLLCQLPEDLVVIHLATVVIITVKLAVLWIIIMSTKNKRLEKHLAQLVEIVLAPTAYLNHLLLVFTLAFTLVVPTSTLTFYLLALWLPFPPLITTITDTTLVTSRRRSIPSTQSPCR